MLRSVKDAAGEIQARLKNGSERRFPVMGLKGAAGVLLLRETALGVTRPIVVVTSRAAEAEALAHEAAFFLDEADDADTPGRRVHHLPAWELKPLANLSPGSDTQAAQIAAMFALLRTPAPIVITSVEALMTRTIPREILNDSIIRVTAGERIDLEPAGRGPRQCGLSAAAAGRGAGRLQRARWNRRYIFAALPLAGPA